MRPSVGSSHAATIDHPAETHSDRGVRTQSTHLRFFPKKKMQMFPGQEIRMRRNGGVLAAVAVSGAKGGPADALSR